MSIGHEVDEDLLNEEESEESDLEEEERELVEQKIRGIDFACRIVERAVTKWLKDPHRPLPNNQGEHVVELGIRKVEKPIKRFSIPWPGGDVSQLAEEIVYSAGIDLVNSQDDQESYVVRLFGGNASRTFPLSLNERKSEEQGGSSPHDDSNDAMAPSYPHGMVVSGGARDMNTMLHGQNGEAPSMGALILSHQAEMMSHNRQLMEMLMKSREQESRIAHKTIESQQVRLNELIAQKYEVLEATDEIFSKKHELDREAKEAERAAERENKLEEKLEGIFMKYVLPALAGKMGMAGLVAQEMVTTQPATQNGAAPEAAAPVPPGMTPIEEAVFSFFRKMSPEQKMKIAQELNPEQRSELIEMMRIFENFENGSRE
jgi:hypothetical protein